MKLKLGISFLIFGLGIFISRYTLDLLAFLLIFRGMGTAPTEFDYQIQSLIDPLVILSYLIVIGVHLWFLKRNITKNQSSWLVISLLIDITILAVVYLKGPLI